MTPDEALERLLAGTAPDGDGEVPEHAPIAAVLTCADARVSALRAFGADRGDLFIVRVAGNAVSDDTLGSIEYAVANLGVPLVMVIGHRECGAVRAAIDVVEDRAGELPGAIAALVDRVVPAVRAVPDGERTVDACVRANAKRAAAQLAASEPVIAQAIAAGKLRVVAAHYDIATNAISVL